jgi:hypothetical protein
MAHGAAPIRRSVTLLDLFLSLTLTSSPLFHSFDCTAEINQSHSTCSVSETRYIYLVKDSERLVVFLSLTTKVSSSLTKDSMQGIFYHTLSIITPTRPSESTVILPRSGLDLKYVRGRVRGLVLRVSMRSEQ